MEISIFTVITLYWWAAIFTVWLVGQFGNKRTQRRPRLFVYLGTTALLGVSFALFFSLRLQQIFLWRTLTPRNEFFGVLGDVICIGGVVLAVWARLELGRNWSGSTATLKDKHDLVRTGPYQLVRHPIYTGFSMAMLGTALTSGLVSHYVGFLFGVTAFLIRIPIEERLMLEMFPGAYERYMHEVKKLFPFIW